MDISAVLAPLGLSNKETKLYMTTLQLGMAPVSVIARRAGLKRPTAYEVLSRLCDKGIAHCFFRKRVKYYSVISPQRLHETYTSRVEELHRALPAMMAMENTLSPKPKITYYEGKEDVRRLYLAVLEAKGEVLNYFLPEKPFAYFGEEWVYKMHIRERVKRRIQLRVIMPKSAYSERYLKRGKSELREVRVIQNASWSFTNETYIYDNAMSIFSFDEDFAVLIESADVVRTQRILFELAWASALVK